MDFCSQTAAFINIINSNLFQTFEPLISHTRLQHYTILSPRPYSTTQTKGCFSRIHRSFQPPPLLPNHTTTAPSFLTKGPARSIIPPHPRPMTYPLTLTPPLLTLSTAACTSRRAACHPMSSPPHTLCLNAIVQLHPVERALQIAVGLSGFEDGCVAGGGGVAFGVAGAGGRGCGCKWGGRWTVTRARAAVWSWVARWVARWVSGLGRGAERRGGEGGTHADAEGG